MASHNPERVMSFLQLLNVFLRSVSGPETSSCMKVPVPNSINCGACKRSFCNWSKLMFRFTFKTLRDFDLEMSFSRASKLTSLFKLAKLRTSNEVKLSGKQLNQWPPRSSIPFSWISSSVMFLQEIVLFFFFYNMVNKKKKT